MERSRNRHKLVLAACAVVALLACWWTWKWHRADPQTMSGVSHCAVPGANAPDGVLIPRLPPPPVAPEVKIPVTVDSAEDACVIAVAWIGRAPASELPLTLRSQAGPELAATVDASAIRLKQPPQGSYQFDFAGAGVFGPDHRLTVHDRKLSVAAFQFGPDSRLVLALAVPVQATASLRDGGTVTQPVEFFWSPKVWTPGTPPPTASLELKGGQPTTVLVPLDGMQFQVATPGLAVISPRPQEFVPRAAGDRLEIVLGAMVPVTIDVIESEPGQWDKVLAKRPSPYLKVRVDAIEAATGRSVPLQANALIARDKPRQALPGMADRFQLYIPELATECTLYAMIELHGGGIEASGSVAAGPNSREVRIVATPTQRCDLRIRIASEQGDPVSGVSVSVSALFLASGSQSSLTGQPVEGVSDANGSLLIQGLPSGPNLVAELILEQNVVVVSDTSRVQLAKSGVLDVAVVVRVPQGAAIALTVTGGKAWRPGSQARIVVIEGDGRGRWFELVRLDVPVDGAAVQYRPRHDNALVLLQCGHCLMARVVRPSGNPADLRFDLDSTVEVRPAVAATATTGAAYVMLEQVDPVLAWASGASQESRLPGVAVDKAGQCLLRVEQWVAEDPALWLVDATAVRPLRGVDGAASAVLKSTETSMVEIRLQQPTGTRDAKVFVCPIFIDDGRKVTVELGLGRTLSFNADAAQTLDIPHGRYVAVATWVDQQGAQRFGLFDGQYIEFESKSGLKTVVELRIP